MLAGRLALLSLEQIFYIIQGLGVDGKGIDSRILGSQPAILDSEDLAPSLMIHPSQQRVAGVVNHINIKW